MENKLASYRRVSIAYVSEFVLYTASGEHPPSVSISTYYLYVFLWPFLISCISYIIKRLRPSTVCLRRQSNWTWEWVNQRGVLENKNFGMHYDSCLYASRCIFAMTGYLARCSHSVVYSIHRLSQTSNSRGSGTVSGQWG